MAVKLLAPEIAAAAATSKMDAKRWRTTRGFLGSGRACSRASKPVGELRSSGFMSSNGTLLLEALAMSMGWSKAAARIALELGRRGRTQTTFGWP